MGVSFCSPGVSVVPVILEWKSAGVSGWFCVEVPTAGVFFLSVGEPAFPLDKSLAPPCLGFV